MNYLFCQISLFLWLPVVAAFFAFLPPRKAVVVSYIAAWLALPNIGFDLPGLPNYTKMSATLAGVMDPARFISTRVGCLRSGFADTTCRC